MPAPLHVDHHPDGVVVLRLDVADRRNAMTEELTQAWAATLGALATDTEVRCVVVTGEGPAFCAGGDLAWLAESASMTPAQARARMLPFYRAWLAVRDLPVPTIAAVNGAAIGAGLALALACDLPYATPEAPLAMPFTALGIHPGMASTWLLPEVVGLPVARDLLLTGRSVRGAEAMSLGLVNGVFEADVLRAEVLGIGATVAARAPIATQLTKAALAGGGHATFEAALAWESVAQPLTMATADHSEGIAAVRARRTPRFTGR